MVAEGSWMQKTRRLGLCPPAASVDLSMSTEIVKLNRISWISVGSDVVTICYNVVH